MDDVSTWQAAMSIGIGLGLAAAAGFRVFVPLLVLSVAARAGYLPLSAGFEWIGTTPALLAFVLNFLPKSREISRQYRWRNQLHDPPQFL